MRDDCQDLHDGSKIASAKFRNTDKQNAVRHFIWQFGISIYVHSGAPYLAGKAHEFGAPDEYERKTDEANNIQAGAYARKNRLWLLGLAGATSLENFLNEMAALGGYLFDTGYLYSVEEFK